MTEAKKSDFSARLGVKRSKPPINAPPKAATATSSKLKRDEVQRRKNPFNDMLHTRSQKDKETRRSPSSKRTDTREESSRRSEDGRRTGDGVYDSRAAERIADLERALSLMKQEQEALREDMVKMRENGAAFQEMTEDYRRQLATTPAASSQNELWDSPSKNTQRMKSRSNSSHLRSPPGAFHSDSRPASRSSHSNAMDIFEEDEPPRQPRGFSDHRQDDLIDQTHDLRLQVAQLQDQIQSQELAYQSKFRVEAEWQELTARLHTAEKESEERLQHLLSLKSSISYMTRMEAQCTDSELSESLSQLANRVREWVISNFRKTKINYNNLPPSVAKALEIISPDYKHINDRLALYQALIASTLMQIFREPLIVGVPETGPLASLKQAAKIMKRDPSSYGEWRRCTIRSLEAVEGNTIRSERGELIHRLANELSHRLFTLTSTNVTPQARQSLEGILNTAADIRRTLWLQKAEYLVHFFRNQDGHSILFDDDRMESIHDIDGLDEDGDILLEREFGFCVFPSLEKFGDEHGENADVNNVLLKARVYCKAS
ncbi:hypothetical protein DM02DRAFT_194608 [Periconia macrospinosa]|uniref:Uncharacterized protein n=1 Tax=Periconia macrospinosa TaxID=97972 RepID=A0A2V1DAZ0_9PLEO|nr:hypothetical protein DM02DRAFT_194608 [Periconia macrospinosa]